MRPPYHRDSRLILALILVALSIAFVPVSQANAELVWVTRAPMPTVRSDFGVATGLNGKIYVIGGQDSTGALNIVEEYDPVKNIWQTRAPMPTPRSALGVVAARDGKIYAIGGVGLNHALSYACLLYTSRCV